MSRRLQVFISSTYLDLRDERQAVVQAVLKYGFIPAGMELFAAQDKEQMTVIKRWIDESDAFIILLGGRYGTVEATTGKSYTELEFEYARECSKPYFPVVLSDSFIKRKTDAASRLEDVVETSEPQLLAKFRSRLLENMSGFADDMKDVAHEVLLGLRRIDRDYPQGGWIRASDAPDLAEEAVKIAALAEEVAGLRAERAALLARLQESERQTAPDLGLLARRLDEIPLWLEIDPESEPKEGTLFSFLLQYSPVLAIGVNDRNSSSVPKQLYTLAARLMPYGVTEFDKHPPSQVWRRIILSELGSRLVQTSLLSGPPNGPSLQG